MCLAFLYADFLNRPFRCPHAAFSAAAFERRACRGRTADQPFIVAYYDFAIGADIYESRNLWAVADAGGQNPGGDIPTNIGTHPGQAAHHRFGV